MSLWNTLQGKRKSQIIKPKFLRSIKKKKNEELQTKGLSLLGKAAEGIRAGKRAQWSIRKINCNKF